MYLSLAAGHAQYRAAAGALEKLVILALAEAILPRFPLALALGTHGEERVVLGLALSQPPRKSAHEAEYYRRQPKPAQHRAERAVEQLYAQSGQQQSR